MVTVRPETVASQAKTVAAAAERRAVKLWLVVESDAGVRQFPTDADQAWVYANDAYDHFGSGVFGPPDRDATCYYRGRT